MRYGIKSKWHLTDVASCCVQEWRRRGKLTVCLMVKLRFRLGLVTETVSTLHVALENGSDVHANERQKIRHYRDRSTGE